MGKGEAERANSTNAGADEQEGASAQTRAEVVARLFREHNQALVSLLALRLKSLQDAKEVAQEAYVRLLQLDRPGAVSLLRAYLFRIASNLAVDRLRHNTVKWRTSAAVEAELFDMFDGCNEPERNVLASDTLEFLRGCLSELPEPCQRAFWMHRVEGESVADIARTLRVTERMVRNHLTRAIVYCQLRLGGATPQQAKERMKR